MAPNTTSDTDAPLGKRKRIATFDPNNSEHDRLAQKRLRVNQKATLAGTKTSTASPHPLSKKSSSKKPAQASSSSKPVPAVAVETTLPTTPSQPTASQPAASQPNATTSQPTAPQPTASQPAAFQSAASHRMAAASSS
ncbi:hypothetical protein CPC08DRAFT_761956, partial [Agrocybe pediades]